MQITANVYLVPRVIACTYVIVEPNGLTLIDAALPSSAGRILGFIHGLGYRPTDVKRILITHADVDHVGSLEMLRMATQASVAASPVEAEAIRSGQRSRPLKAAGPASLPMVALTALLKAQPSQVDQELEPGMELPILGGLQVLDTPGHTPNHVSFWAPGPRLLFSGDSFLIRPYRFFPSRGVNNWDQSLSNMSFRVEADLHPAIVCGGHGWTNRDVQAKFERL